MLEDFDQCVTEFMNDFGGVGILHIAGTSIRNPDTNDLEVVVTPIQVRAILLDLTLQSNGLQTVAGSLIQAGDKRCYIQPINKTNPALAMPVVQPNKDKFEMGDITYTIVTLKEINPTATNNVLYELYLRR